MGEYNGVVGGVSSIVTDGFEPWWTGYEGTVQADMVDETLTARQAYERALDWQVDVRTIYIEQEVNGEKFFLPIEGKKATVKADDGTVLGVVSDSYGVTQNEVLLDLAEALKTHGDVYCTSAGTLYEHKVAWMLLKLGEDKSFDGHTNIMRFLMVATGHGGTMSLSARPTNVRIECMNTFEWGIKGTPSVVNLRHTANVNDRLEEAKRIISETYDHFGAMDREIEQLIATEYGRTRYQDVLVPALVGEKPSDEHPRAVSNWESKRDGLVAAYERPDQRELIGTGWGAVMAANAYELWGANVKKISRSESHARRAVSGDFPLTARAKELVLA